MEEKEDDGNASFAPNFLLPAPSSPPQRTLASWTDLALEVAIVWSVQKEKDEENGLKEVQRKGRKRVSLELDEAGAIEADFCFIEVFVGEEAEEEVEGGGINEGV